MEWISGIIYSFYDIGQIMSNSWFIENEFILIVKSPFGLLEIIILTLKSLLVRWLSPYKSYEKASSPLKPSWTSHLWLLQSPHFCRVGLPTTWSQEPLRGRSFPCHPYWPALLPLRWTLAESRVKSTTNGVFKWHWNWNFSEVTDIFSDWCGFHGNEARSHARSMFKPKARMYI